MVLQFYFNGGTSSRFSWIIVQRKFWKVVNKFLNKLLYVCFFFLTFVSVSWSVVIPCKLISSDWWFQVCGWIMTCPRHRVTGWSQPWCGAATVQCPTWCLWSPPRTITFWPSPSSPTVETTTSCSRRLLKELLLVSLTVRLFLKDVKLLKMWKWIDVVV